MALKELTAALHEFAKERDWEQFHNPKNFAVALSVEAAEVLEYFTWLDDKTCSAELKNDPEKLAKIRLELADVLINVVQLARHLDVDVEEAAWEKLELLKQRYSLDKVKGYNTKIADQAS